MKTTPVSTYPGIVHGSARKGYSICFPDFPGCVSAADSLDALRDMAREALALHIEGMREDGADIPKPTTLEAARRHEFAGGADLFLAVDVPVPASHVIRLNVTMPEAILRKVDTYARKTGLARSTILSRAAERYVTAS
ncbi:MAG: hypothetical protein A3K19_06130 [Lentisphaerae bacterium RIFOXYB12_FULL_65_16]|nr:MAG: hypothetical protein A3K18_34730 [Lentisphaerae bacterium RIFOXYA12_64_32]OGV94049.1 MAG: hypothetical protein A3K19_06130 [Lentisphaerae bacterium RIFOXYB12_FULL_65_16]